VSPAARGLQESDTRVGGPGGTPHRLPAGGSAKALLQTLDRLRQTSPEPAARAAAALAVVLGGLDASPWSEVAWSFSRLTGGGYPVELTFSSADETFRWAAEVAGPEVAEAVRLDAALHHLEVLGEPTPPAWLAAAFRTVQGSAPLRFGAWLGGRHSSTGDRYKVYLEVPEAEQRAACELLEKHCGRQPPRFPGSSRLVMIGYTPSSRMFEWYLRTSRIQPWELAFLMRQSDLAAQGDELLDFVAGVSGLPLTRALAVQPLGVSVAAGKGKAPAAVTLFAPAGAFFGSDGTVRRRLLALASDAGRGLEGYRTVSEPVAERTGWNTRHGILSLVSARGEPPHFRIGLRPS